MKIWHGHDWNEIASSNDLSKIYCDDCKLYDAYHILIDGEHIFLLEISISKSWMNQNDEKFKWVKIKVILVQVTQKSICTKMELVISYSVLNRFWWTKDPIKSNKRGYKGM